MRSTHDQPNQPLDQMLAGLHHTPPRNPQVASCGRDAYLSEVKALLQEHINQQSVSPNPFKRLNDWINTIPILMRRKERSPMFTVLSTVMVVAALLLGGAGATVYASQESLPNQALYPVKTLYEDAHLAMTSDPQEQVELALSFANRRMEELAAMQQNQQEAPEGLVTRLQLQLQQALRVSTGMEDAPMQQALLQIRNAIRQMEQATNQLGEPSAAGETILAQVRNVLRNQYRLCDLGLQDPAQLRLMFKNQNQPNKEPLQAPSTEPPTMGDLGNGAGSKINPESGECLECNPAQDGSGSGPGPNPGGSESNGPGDCADCTPVQDGSGPGPGPNAGEGESNGPGACTDCTPAQDGTGPGPGPNNGPGSQSESEVSPGSGVCTNCSPAQEGSGSGTGSNVGGGSGSDADSGGSESGDLGQRGGG